MSEASTSHMRPSGIGGIGLDRSLPLTLSESAFSHYAVTQTGSGISTEKCTTCWRGVDHERKDLESVVTKRRDKHAALKLLRKLMRNYCNPDTIATDKLKSYDAALRDLGVTGHETNGRWINNREENSDQPFR